MISKIFFTKKSKNLHPLFYFSSQELIKCEYFQSKVALLTLNRPKQLNALNENLINQLIQALTTLDSDPNIHVIVITGNEKAFAAGGDLKEMKDKTFPQTYTQNLLGSMDIIQNIKKPIIAAVNGYALGGGCELAMMCDIIVAGKSAKFGLPEQLIGTIPGCGGTVRLTKAFGKSKSMEHILSGEFFDAQTAEKHGLISKVVEPEETITEAIKMAEKIALFSNPIVNMAKECINQSYNLTLRDSIQYEKKLFHSTFSTKDTKEGMSAFVEKRKPTWRNE